MVNIRYFVERKEIADMSELPSDSRAYKMLSNVKIALNQHSERVNKESGTIDVQFTNDAVFYSLVGFTDESVDFFRSVLP